MQPVGVITASIIFGALILKLVDFAKFLRNGDINGIISMAIAWGVGIVAIELIQITDWDSEVSIGKQTLATLDFSSELVLALVATSVASYLYDLKKAIDNTDSASTPRFTQDAETARKARITNVLGERAVH